MTNINRILCTVIWISTVNMSSYCSEGSSLVGNENKVPKKYTYSVGSVDANLKYPAKGDPVEMAYQFLELNKGHFRMVEPRRDMVLEKVTSDSKITRVILKQVYHGMSVDAGARIFLKDTGEMHLFEITYYDDINLPTSHSIDSANAVKIALRETGTAPAPKVVCPSKPIIIPSSEIFRYNENKFYMAWPIKVYPDSMEKAAKGYSKFYRYYIDALNGSVLQKGEDSDLKREPLDLGSGGDKK